MIHEVVHVVGTGKVSLADVAVELSALLVGCAGIVVDALYFLEEEVDGDDCAVAAAPDAFEVAVAGEDHAV